MVDYETFVEDVASSAGTTFAPAERATRAVLETLAERIDRGEARDLAAQLPPELSPWIATTTPAEGFNVDEFVRRVAEREDVDPDTAERHTRAVFGALSRAVDRREYDQMAAQLSKDYSPLLARGPHVEVVSSEFFFERVAERAGLDPNGARDATEAVLETLGERIAGGEVEDLIARLPLTLHDALRRGEERSGGKATRMGVDAFVRRVAEREGVDLDTARDHVRAVMRTLRDAVGSDEFSDVTVELPDEYVSVLS